MEPEIISKTDMMKIIPLIKNKPIIEQEKILRALPEKIIENLSRKGTDLEEATRIAIIDIIAIYNLKHDWTSKNNDEYGYPVKIIKRKKIVNKKEVDKHIADIKKALEQRFVSSECIKKRLQEATNILNAGDDYYYCSYDGASIKVEIKKHKGEYKMIVRKTNISPISKNKE